MRPLGSQARFPSARRSPARHRPRCRGIGRCFLAWNAQAAVEQPEDSSCACRSASLWFSASSASRRLMDRVLRLRPSDARSSRTGGSRRGVISPTCSERDTAHPVAGISPATQKRRLSSAPSVRTALAAVFSSGSRWPGEAPDFHA